MKKVVLILLSLLFISNVQAAELKNVELINCDSVSNIWMKIDGKVERVKLIAFDEGEGSLNNEINEYACTILKSAKNIEIEEDPAKTEKDTYNRKNIWVYVEDNLFQDMLISKGYGQVNFVTGDYLYTNKLCETQKEALTKKLGIWNYPDIKEEYCQSGVDINSTEEKKEEEKEDSSIDTKNLRYLVLINSGIVLLLIIFRKR